MIKLISRKYPELRIHHGDANVKFEGGEAEVPDALAKELLALDDLELAEAGAEDDEPGDDSEEESDPAPDTGEAKPKPEPKPEPAATKRKPARPAQAK